MQCLMTLLWKLLFSFYGTNTIKIKKQGQSQKLPLSSFLVVTKQILEKLIVQCLKETIKLIITQRTHCPQHYNDDEREREKEREVDRV